MLSTNRAHDCIRKWTQKTYETTATLVGRVRKELLLYWCESTREFSYQAFSKNPLEIWLNNPTRLWLSPIRLFRKVNLYRILDNGAALEVQSVSDLSLRKQWERLCFEDKCLTIFITALCIAPLAIGIFLGLVSQGIVLSLVVAINAFLLKFFLVTSNQEIHSVIDRYEIIRKIQTTIKNSEKTASLRETLRGTAGEALTQNQDQLSRIPKVLYKEICNFLPCSDTLIISSVNKKLFFHLRMTHTDDSQTIVEKVVVPVRIGKFNKHAGWDKRGYNRALRRAFGDENLFCILQRKTREIYPAVTVADRFKLICTFKLTFSFSYYFFSSFVQKQSVTIIFSDSTAMLPMKFLNNHLLNFNLLYGAEQQTVSQDPPFFGSNTPLHAFLSGKFCQLRLKTPMVRTITNNGINKMEILSSIPIAIGTQIEETMRAYLEITKTENSILIAAREDLPVLSEV